MRNSTVSVATTTGSLTGAPRAARLRLLQEAQSPHVVADEIEGQQTDQHPNHICIGNVKGQSSSENAEQCAGQQNFYIQLVPGAAEVPHAENIHGAENRKKNRGGQARINHQRQQGHGKRTQTAAEAAFGNTYQQYHWYREQVEIGIINHRIYRNSA